MRYGATPRAQRPQLTQASNLGCRSYVLSSYAVWRCWSVWCRARCARGLTLLKRAIHPRPEPPCQIPRRAISSSFTNCSTRVFDQNAVKSALGRHRPHFCVILRCYTYTRSNASNLTHTASRVGAAASPKHARGGPGDCEGYVHTDQGLPRGCVAATGWATSIGARRLFGIEQEAAMDAVVGTHAPRRAVHATVHSKSNIGWTTLFAATELAVRARISVCSGTV